MGFFSFAESSKKKGQEMHAQFRRYEDYGNGDRMNRKKSVGV